MATFLKPQETEKLKPSRIEIVGYKVDEDEKYIHTTNDKNGVTFKRVITLPKNLITETVEVTPTKNIKVGEITEVKYIDTQMTGNTVSMTLDKLLKAPNPPVCEVCGFIVSENEQDVVIAQEKDEDSKYRGLSIIPKKFIVQGN